MTKHVFSNHMTAHVWANQSQESGRSNNGNLSFEGDTLFSYRTPIARILRDNAGEWVALMTTRKYSTTTEGKHKNAAHSALRGTMCFTVPSLGERRFMDCPPDHAANLQHLAKEYADLKGRCTRARADRQETHTLEWLDERATRARSYAESFGLPEPEFDPETDAAEIACLRRARAERANSPEGIRKRVLATAARERRKEREADNNRRAIYDQLQGRFGLWASDPERYQYCRPRAFEFPSDSCERAYLADIEAQEREQERLEAQEAFAAWKAGTGTRPETWVTRGGTAEFFTPEQLAEIGADEIRERLASEQEKREAWLRGSPNYWRGEDATGGALLRVRGDNLETSQGASVPLAHAIKAFRFLKLVRERGEPWVRNGRAVRVGAFQIDRIESNGDFKAGCHVIRWAESERIARELGVFDQPASMEAEERRAAVAS